MSFGEVISDKAQIYIRLKPSLHQIQFRATMLAYFLFGFLCVVSVRCDEGLKVVDLFHAADENHDDYLTRIELDHIFLMFDTNNDSSITPTEFVNDWQNVYNLGGPQDAQTLFTRADTNDDGYITSADIPYIFSYFDQDGNGLVDISEFLTQWSALSEQTENESNVSIDITG